MSKEEGTEKILNEILRFNNKLWNTNNPLYMSVCPTYVLIQDKIRYPGKYIIHNNKYLFKIQSEDPIGKVYSYKYDFDEILYQLLKYIDKDNILINPSGYKYEFEEKLKLIQRDKSIEELLGE